MSLLGNKKRKMRNIGQKAEVDFTLDKMRTTL